MEKGTLKVLLIALVCLSVSLGALPAYSQESKQEQKSENRQDMLTSKDLEREGEDLNKQILTLNQEIQKTLRDYSLLKDDVRKNLKTVPYQTNVRFASDNQGSFIEIERHKFIRDPLHNSKLIGIKTKKFKLYYSGDTVNKLATEIFERYYDDNTAVKVDILDPTPGSEDTSDITFTHTMLVNFTIDNPKFRKDVKLVDNKALRDIQNDTAFPIRNDLKRNFLMPNLIYINNVLIDVAESYYKGKKDAENLMMDFLVRSINH
jgi:hypothetical protein